MFLHTSSVRLRRIYFALFLAICPRGYCDEVLSPDSQDLFGNTSQSKRTAVGLFGNSCTNCHLRPPSESVEELSPDIRGSGSDGWILNNEIKTWNEKDLHFQAYAVLKGQRSQEIAKRLAGDGTVIEAHRDRRCLTCHSSVPFHQMEADGNQVKAETHNDPIYTMGVSCEACHGPTGLGRNEQLTENSKKSWGEVHTVVSKWRTLSPEAKFTELGYWDVHSIRTQTRVCLSCHVGNAEQHKLITHEIYAAGHPPLPSFELSQFVDQMPRHWRRYDEKSKRARDDFNNSQRENASPKQVASEPIITKYPVTKTSMIAALVTLEESLRLSANLMSPADDELKWPELANYSCFSCHHELQSVGWRKNHRLTTVAGRPSLHEWPFALSRVVAADFANVGAEFNIESKVAGVIAALDASPYGHQPDLKSAAIALAQSLQKSSETLAVMPIDLERAVRFTEAITKRISIAPVDFDSARQFAWAFAGSTAEIESLQSHLKNERNDQITNSSELNFDHWFSKELNVILSSRLQADRTCIAQITLYNKHKLKDGKEAEPFTHRIKEIDLKAVFDRISKYELMLNESQSKRQNEQQLKTIDSTQ